MTTQSKLLIPLATLLLFGIVLLSSLVRSNQSFTKISEAKKNNPSPIPTLASVSCEFPNTSQKTPISVYIKGTSLRVKGLTLKLKGKGNMLIKRNGVWIWEDGAKDGRITTFTRKKKENDSFVFIEDSPNQMVNNLLDIVQEETQLCKKDSYPNAVFDIPKDIVFTNIPNKKK